jgi:hypothetical protein
MGKVMGLGVKNGLISKLERTQRNGLTKLKDAAELLDDISRYNKYAAEERNKGFIWGTAQHRESIAEAERWEGWAAKRKIDYVNFYTDSVAAVVSELVGDESFTPTIEDYPHLIALQEDAILTTQIAVAEGNVAQAKQSYGDFWEDIKERRSPEVIVAAFLGAFHGGVEQPRLDTLKNEYKGSVRTAENYVPLLDNLEMYLKLGQLKPDTSITELVEDNRFKDQIQLEKQSYTDVNHSELKRLGDEVMSAIQKLKKLSPYNFQVEPLRKAKERFKIGHKEESASLLVKSRLGLFSDSLVPSESKSATESASRPNTP